MLFAIDKNGNRVHIDEAIKENQYRCPICDELLILKKGKIKTHHFAHKANTLCTDWWTCDKTKWHRDWQDRFPKEWQEVVLEYNGKKHRADVLIEHLKIVIEFQNSRISSEEFQDRNDFYNALGYKVIWVFNVIEKYQNNQIYKCEYERTKCMYEWKRGSETFFQLDARNENVIVFLQIKCFPEDDDILCDYIENGKINYDKIRSCLNYYFAKEHENDKIELLRVTRNSSFLKRFYVDPKIYELNDFMNLFKQKDCKSYETLQNTLLNSKNPL